MSCVHLLSVPFKGCVAILLEYLCPLCIEYTLLSPEHAAKQPPPPTEGPFFWCSLLCCGELFSSRRRAGCPDNALPSPRWRGRPGLQRGLGAGTQKGVLEKSCGSCPSPSVTSPSDRCFDGLIAGNGFFEKPLFSTGAKSSVAASTAIRYGQGGFIFSQQRRTAISSLPFLMSCPTVRNVLVLIDVDSCKHLTVSSISPRTFSGIGSHLA